MSNYNYNYKSPIECYNKMDKGRYTIRVGENIDGDTFDSLEDWYSCPYKYEIMNDAMKFKNYLRTLKEVDGYFNRMIANIPIDIGRIGETNITPILESTKLTSSIEGYIRDFDSTINNINKYGGVAPKSLINTDLGNRILRDLNNTYYSENVFCHNALYYKSFVLRDNKLIGIRNWQYAGFYPPEFEDVVHKYLEYI